MAGIASRSGAAMGVEATISQALNLWIVRSRRASMVKQVKRLVKRLDCEACVASGVAV
jgi:hypothetical protein